MATATPEPVDQARHALLAADDDEGYAAMRSAFAHLRRLVFRCAGDDPDQVPTIGDMELAVARTEIVAMKAIEARHQRTWALLPAQVRARAEERTAGSE